MKKLSFLLSFNLFFAGVGISQASWQTSDAVSPVSSYRGASAVHYDGDQQFLFVFGGWSTSSGNFNETSVYNFTDDTWSVGPAIPENTKGGSAVCIGNDIYLLIGNDGVDANLNSTLFLKYNVSEDGWEYLAEYPVPARYVSMAYNSFNGLIYCAGGSGDDYAAVDQVNAYDPELNSWISCTSLPYISSGGSALVFQGNHLYLIGGLIYEPYDKLFKGLVDVDDPSLISWTQGMSMPVEMLKVSAGYIGNGQILATELTGTFVYDITTDQWTEADNKPTPVKGGNFANIESDNIFTLAVAGGKSADELFVDHAEYFSGDENTLFPATFVVNFNAGDIAVNAEIVIGEEILYTDDAGCAVLYLENGSYEYSAEWEELMTSGSFTIDGAGAYVDIQLPVLISEKSMSFSIYPNPSKGLLNIGMEQSEVSNEMINVEVLDLMGKPLYSLSLDCSGKQNLDLSQLNRGVYYLIISKSDDLMVIEKIIIN